MPIGVGYGGYGGRVVKRRRYSAPLQSNRRASGLLGIEQKYIDADGLTVLTDVACEMLKGTEGMFDTNLNTVSQGNGATQREGNAYVMKSCVVRGDAVIDADAAVATQINSSQLEVALILDTQANGTDGDALKIWKAPGASAENRVHSFRNLEFATRYKLLDSKVITLEAPVGMWDGVDYSTPAIISAPFTLSWKGLQKVTCNATTGAASAIRDNALFIVVRKKGGNFSSNPAMKVSWASRIRFVG